MNYSSWYQKAFTDLSGYGLWLRGGELNTIPAVEFERRPFRVLITRLSTWRDTADSFTHKLLYQIIGRIGAAYPDLAYLPPPRDVPVFDRDKVPWLLGSTSKHEGRDFSVIALSLSIVQELLNIPVMLQKSGIPLSKRERLLDPEGPLVILGGASALYTSALFDNDPLVDGIFAGEDARIIAKLFQTCKNGYAQKLTKETLLEELQKIPGFFMPDGKPATKVFRAAELPPEQLLESGPVLYDEECIGKTNLQISEGCACFCNFCAESFSRKPYREFSLPHLRKAAKRLKAHMGAHDLELYSFNFSMHRDFYRILREAADVFPSIGLKSQRFDSIAADPELVKFLHAVNKTSITCGIEGISPRLRRYLHKGLEEEELNKSLTVLLSSPIRELKIFLIATGLEEQDDYDEFRKLLSFIKKIEGTPRIIFSMTILVRFPWTPLEFEDAPDPFVCQTVLRTTERLVHAAGFEFRASSDSADYWISQILVRADDPRIAAAFWQAQNETGFVYYREIHRSFTDAVRRHLERKDIKHHDLLRGFAPPDRAAKPWNALETGVSERFLIKQWASAKKYEDNGYCAGTGACSDDAARKQTLRRPDKKTYSADQFRKELHNAKAEEVTLCFHVRIGPALAGVPHRMRHTALARALMLTEKKLVEGYRGPAPQNGLGSDWVIGDDSLVLVWSRETATALRELMNDAVFIEKVNTMLKGWVTLTGLGVHDQPCQAGLAGIKTIIFRSPFHFDPSEYCKNRSLKFTLRKSGPGTLCYVLSAESLKKKILGECMAEPESGGYCTVSVTPGPKFIPEEFARTAFKLSAENEWVRTAMTAKFSSFVPHNLMVLNQI